MKTEDFIDKAINIHNNKYDYSLVDYKNTDIKIKIICKNHGIFEQTPHNHLSGANCPKCAIEQVHIKQRSTKENFIDKAIKIHGDKYDYSLVEYITNKIKIKIICKKDNYIFEQTPISHLNGFGCPLCGGTKKLTKEEFIEKAIKIHGNKYDYSDVIYISIEEKIKIKCLKDNHIFEQTPHSHLSGANCPKCTGHLKTIEEIILKFNKNHNNKYDYSLVDYKNIKTKVKIICPKHGIFEQSPHTHYKSGCPKCNLSKGEIIIDNFLKNNNIIFENQKRFKDCKYKYTLPFDFYLPEYNLLIEYDGKQHFLPYYKFGGEKGLKLIQKKDKIKNEYCKNIIDLLRISYIQINDIEKILKEKLNIK